MVDWTAAQRAGYLVVSSEFGMVVMSVVLREH